MLTPVKIAFAAGPSIKTTLTDNAIQKGSKKTFDVWASDSSGKKIKVTVKLNGEKIEPTWDDSEKTSYTLVFTKEGENTVTVSASSDGGKKKELKYHITYKKAKNGEKIGSAVWSIEAFTIGCGYIVYPVREAIYEGENASQQLLRILKNAGFTAYYGGTVNEAFYLAYIADGTAESEKYNGYKRSDTPSKARKLSLTPSIPSMLRTHLKSSMTFYDPDDYKNWGGYLGEFAFTNGSGWMYSVNNIFPNVGFADTYLSDGDVVRVQYTLGYGADIGGFSSVGSNIPNVDNQPKSGYYSVANKDELTSMIANALASENFKVSNIQSAYKSALNAAFELDASQSKVDSCAKSIENALNNPTESTTLANGEKTTAVSTTAVTENQNSTSKVTTTKKAETAENATTSVKSENAVTSKSNTKTMQKTDDTNKSTSQTVPQSTKKNTDTTASTTAKVSESEKSDNEKNTSETVAFSQSEITSSVESISSENSQTAEENVVQSTSSKTSFSETSNAAYVTSESDENGEKSKNSSVALILISACIVATVSFAVFVKKKGRTSDE